MPLSISPSFHGLVSSFFFSCLVHDMILRLPRILPQANRVSFGNEIHACSALFNIMTDYALKEPIFQDDHVVESC